MYTNRKSLLTDTMERNTCQLIIQQYYVTIGFPSKGQCCQCCHTVAYLPTHSITPTRHTTLLSVNDVDSTSQLWQANVATMAGQPQLTVTKPISLFTVEILYDRSPQNAVAADHFAVKNPFLTWHNGHIENFKMEWLLDQSLND